MQDFFVPSHLAFLFAIRHRGEGYVSYLLNLILFYVVELLNMPVFLFNFT